MPHKNRDQLNAYFRAYYQAHKVERIATFVRANRKARHAKYAKIQALKSHPCTDCRKSFAYYVMDFDHRDPSEKNRDVSIMVKNGTAWKTVLTEIAKCDLVCACCHRLRTYHGNHSYKTRRFEQHKLVLDALKSTTPCLDCEALFKPCQMDFDHVGVERKSSNIARLVEGSTENLTREIGKCHLVCANCHRVRGFTGERKNSPEHSQWLVTRFHELMSRTPLSEDARFNSFPMPELLGKVSDKELSLRTGVSKAMVAWYRRKAGIRLDRQGRIQL